jgi:hypothetical protein
MLTCERTPKILGIDQPFANRYFAEAQPATFLLSNDDADVGTGQSTHFDKVRADIGRRPAAASKQWWHSIIHLEAFDMRANMEGRSLLE